MKISIIVEGATEAAFRQTLRDFLKSRGLAGGMPRLDFVQQDGRIPTDGKLKRMVERLLNEREPAQAVIALTDVYTGTREFRDAEHARQQMRVWVGSEKRFHPHAAQYEFEAWLLPYWPKIQKLAGHNKAVPSGNPESVNHDSPPSERISEIFRAGTCRRHYSKVRDGAAILRGEDLLLAARACCELRCFLNTILHLCGGEIIPDQLPPGTHEENLHDA